MSYCNDCGKQFHLFRWSWKCGHCGEYHCSSCLSRIKDFTYLSVDPFPNAKFCDHCIKKVITPVYHKYLKAEENNFDVHTYPITYKGKVKYNEKSKKKLVTCWTRGDADMYLRVDAAFAGFDAVVDVRTEKETRMSKNYRYTVVRKVGYGVNLSK